MKPVSAVLTVALLAAPAAHGREEPKRDDFAYSMELATKPGQALHRLTVPLDVYRHTVRDDLADVRILNAHGEIVPYALQRPIAATKSVRASSRLPLFPLRGDPTSATQELRLSVASNGTNIELQTTQRATEGLPISGYLLDARAIDSSLSALSLEWPDAGNGFSAHIVVEASDDLGQWRLVVPASPLVDLRHDSDRLQQRRVEFPSTRAKFWRLRWNNVPGPTELTGVLAEPATSTVEATRHELVEEGVATAQPGEFEFDLRAHPPVDRINLQLPQVNTVADVEFLVPGGKQWRQAWSGSLYRVESSGGDIVNPFVDIAPVTAEHWRVRVNGPGGIGSSAPKLAVRWLPHEITFLARGDAPYELVYGSSTAKSAATSLNSVLSLGGTSKALLVSAAQVGPRREAGGPSRLLPPPEPLPWRAIALWSVLLIAVGVLGAMAWKLARQLRSAQ